MAAMMPEQDALWRRRKTQLMMQPFVHAVASSALPIILTDPHADDNPILFANQAFLDLVGYREDEVLGRNCRFLQGPETDRAALDRLRAAIARGEAISVELCNYRRDGSAFWNELHVAPIHGPDGEVMYFIGSQINVTDRVAAKADLEVANRNLESKIARRTDELQDALERSTLLAREVTHRVHNSLMLIQALFALQERSTNNPERRALLHEMSGRVNAVARIQRLLDDAVGGERRLDLIAMLTALQEDLDAVSDARVALVHDAGVPSLVNEQALPVALAVTELVLNAQKHAFCPGQRGEITIAVRPEDGGATALIEVTDNGRGLPADFDPAQSRGTGMLVVRKQMEQIGGALRIVPCTDGRGACLRLSVPRPPGAAPDDNTAAATARSADSPHAPG